MDQSALKLPCPAEWQGVGMADLTVWVDPLDGTKEYTQVVFRSSELFSTFPLHSRASWTT